MSAQMPATHERQAISLFQRDIVTRALIDSFKKLDPRVQIRNPVMFVVEIGALITTVTWFIQLGGGESLGGHDPAWYTFTISIWLWLTVVFANMAEAFAEGRGRAQADTLRSMRKETVARGSRRTAATRWAWIQAFALEISGSRPEAEVLTASTGIFAAVRPRSYSVLVVGFLFSSR